MLNKCLYLFLAILAFFLFCDLPQDPDNPDNADVSITLLSKYNGTNDTLIEDSTGGEISLLLSYRLPHYIDSVKIYLNSIINTTVTNDTSIFFTFTESQSQKTQYILKLKKAGQKSVVVDYYLSNGTVKTDSARIIVHPRTTTTNTHAPVFIADSPASFYELKNSQILDIPVAAHDSDNNALTFSFVSGTPALPRLSTASLKSGRFTWTSDPTDKGTYQVIFSVTDGKFTVDKNVKIVINDSAVNIAPEITSTPITTVSSGKKWTYKPSVIDFQDTAFTWKLLGKNVLQMVFDTSTGEISWTPVSSTLINDTLTLIVSDRKTPPLSDSQTFVITVTPAENTAPVATPLILSVSEDDSVVISLAGTDLQTPNALIFSVLSGVQNGRLGELRGNKIVYYPNKNFFGKDSMFFRAFDGALFSDSAKVSLTIVAVNDTPSVSKQALATELNTPLSITLKGLDIEDSSLTFHITKLPVSGTLDTNAFPVIKYTPSVNFKGNDSIFFTATDKGGLQSNTGLITVAVASDNQKPTVTSLVIAITEDDDTTIVLKGSDIETPAAKLVYSIYKEPTHGRLGIVNGDQVSYLPAPNYIGSDTFFYKVNDGTLDSDSGRVVIRVEPVNDKPVAVEDQYATNEDQALTISAAEGVLKNDSDSDGDAFTAEVVDLVAVSKGTLTLNANGSFAFTPAVNSNGAVTFSYRLKDANEAFSDKTIVTIMVSPVNDKPVAVEDQYTTNEDQALTISAAEGVLKNDSDPDGDAFTAEVVDLIAASKGTLTLNANGSFVFTPVANTSGPVSFTYRLKDANGAFSDKVTVTITVGAANDKPVAVEDQYTTNEDQVLTISTADGILKNDSDPEGDLITAELVDLVATGKGTLTFNPNGSFGFTPTANSNGPVTFTYRVKDATGAFSDKVTVTITVTPVNDVPVITGLTAITVNESETVEQEITASDPDLTTPTLTITSGQKPWMTTTVIAGNRIRLTLKPGYDIVTSGSTTIAKLYFTASDGTNDKKDSLQITVNNRNQKPVISFNQTKTTDTVKAGDSKTFKVTATDPDGIISKVELYYDNNTPLVDDAAPYEFSLSNIAYGKHFVYAKAYDNNNDTARSITDTIKAGKWNRIDSISDYNKYKNDFDYNGYPVHSYLENPATGDCYVAFSRFNLVSKMWDVMPYIYLNNDKSTYGSPSVYELTFGQDNLPVVVVRFNYSNETWQEYTQSFVVYKLSSDNKWNKIGSPLTFPVTPVTSVSTENIAVSSTGTIALCLSFGGWNGVESAKTYIQSGSTWEGIVNPVNYTSISYLGTTLYSHSNYYMHTGTTQVHVLSGTSWTAVGISDGTVTDTKSWRSFLDRNNEGTLYVTVPDRGIFTYQGSTWEKLWPSTGITEFHAPGMIFVNNTPWFSYSVLNSDANSTYSLYMKQIQNGVATGLLGESGFLFDITANVSISCPSKLGIIGLQNANNGTSTGYNVLYQMDIPK